jgi:mycobactin lysine-N-oxygenase
MPTLAVIGAGPKGIAIAAKARALSAVGLDAPRVVLVDRSAVAGNWSGRQGYTSGLLPLGTPPEKDVGFPYAAGWGPASAAVTTAMAEFNWQRHLIAHGCTRTGSIAAACGRRTGSGVPTCVRSPRAPRPSSGG